MKAEHRKELQTNALADAIGRFLQKLKAGPKTTSIVIWVVILLAVVVVLVWIMVARSARANRSALWLKLGSATTLEELRKLADSNKGSMPGRQARFEQARYLLFQGQERLYSAAERSKALEHLEQAQKLYDGLADDCADAPQLLQEALIGSAVTREARGHVEEARAYYDRLDKQFPKSFLGKEAKKETDQTGARKELYAKLKELTDAASILPPP
jgi:tetratricopeptide (TPR) repeat protein